MRCAISYPIRDRSRFSLLLTFVACLLGLTSSAATAAANPQAEPSPPVFQALHWRSIGPAVFGGRITDISGVTGNPSLLFVAHSSGGLFKSIDGGVTFSSIFNDQDVLSIGAIAVQQDNPNIIYVGTGEANPRNSASFGDGMYKSVNGGQSWQHLGLDDTRSIGRIVIDPKDPSVVYVAAMGHEFGPNTTRGVYRSRDAGKTWERILFVNETTGASDVAVDAADPRIVYAGMYDYLRKPWAFRSGGPGSGLYRSTDGGDTWTRLTDPRLNNGLPSGVLGRIAVAVAPSNPLYVYALLEAGAAGILWRSTDRGITWSMINNDADINIRPFYFSNLRVDPKDEKKVYSLSGELYMSSDGGRTFRDIGSSVHGDHHALWIDPANPLRLLNGSDGGFQVSWNGGGSWNFINTVPMAQAYHVGADMAEPYHVMGGFQDNEVWMGPSTLWNEGGAHNGNWRRLINWGDGMYALPDPMNKDVLYVNSHYGDITRINLRTGERRFITPHPVIQFGGSAAEHKYRFNWNSPILLSDAHAGTVYFGSNVLFRSDNQGTTWRVISPDLTTNDPAKMGNSGGPISVDDTLAETHCTITAIGESVLNPAVLWAGTDDGNLQISSDAGLHWTNVIHNVRGLPLSAWVTSISTSRVSPGGAWISFDRHKLDDPAPYLYHSADFGKTWQSIGAGLRGYVHVVREDPRAPGVLYAGTELGIFVSFNSGASWNDLRLGLPPLPVVDLLVHPRDNDLIIATHARGYYILDDATPLQEMAAADRRELYLFPPITTYRHRVLPDTTTVGDEVFNAENRPYGAIITYYIRTAASSPNLTIEIKDARGHHVRSLSGPAAAGLNRTTWDLREDAADIAADQTAHADAGSTSEGDYLYFGLTPRGPEVVPGRYTVNISSGGQTVSQPVDIRLDPASTASRQDLVAQHDELIQIGELEQRIRASIRSVESLQSAIAALTPKVDDPTLRAKLVQLNADLGGMQEKLKNHFEYRHPAALREQIAQLRNMVESYYGPATVAQRKAITAFTVQLEALEAGLVRIKTQTLPPLNESLVSLHLQPLF